jgi:hypothetical protein
MCPPDAAGSIEPPMGLPPAGRRETRRTVMRKRTAMLTALLVLLAGASCRGRAKAPAGTAERAAAVGIDELTRLDLLPRFKRSAKVGMVSSYDRSGGNDDGFSGKYSFLRKEPAGLVMADLKGPGAIYRIHTPTPTDDIVEFYFDGEAEARLRLKVNQLFDGTRPPFLAPLAGSALGGSTSYVPLTYRTSCKIVIKADTFQFYDINYAEFPAGVEVETYVDPPPAEFLARAERAAAILRRAGTDISDVVAPEGSAARRETMRVRRSLAAGSKAVLYETSKPGRILGIRLKPASALAGPARDILIRAYWDGASEPAIDAPAGDLFGASFGEPAARSLMLGTANDGWDYLYFPMPFERAARIELVSEGDRAVDVEAEIVTAPVGKRSDEGRFYAWWRREDPCAEGRPYTYLRTRGRGHVVGMILQAQGLEPGSTGFFEGDDRVIIDGGLAVPGTGSEDSLNGGWYDVPGRWERRMSLPLSGCLDYKKPMGRTGGYRFMLTDSYAFRESIDYTIEHGPEGNAWPADYASVVFFYAQEPPAAEGPGPGERVARGVREPDRIVFIPGWNVPIHTTSLQNAVWTKASVGVGGERVRVFSMKTGGEDVFGPHHVSWVFDLPTAGRYLVSIKAVLGPDQGIVRIFERDKPAGEAVDLFAAERTLSGPLRLGTFEMAGARTSSLCISSARIPGREAWASSSRRSSSKR